MPTVVTPATLDDLPALSALLALLVEPASELKPDAQAQQRGLSLILSDPSLGLVTVVRHKGQLLGMATLLFTISTALGERVGLLEDVLVHPKHRDAGVGTLLVQGVVEHARWHGCHRLTLLTGADNEAAQRLCEGQGFVVSSMLPYSLSLPGR
jgi:GNAT superfamily N-acetyltransferase